VSNTARRRARAFPAVAAGLVALSWLSTGVAGAAISSASPFAVSPASGPPGTVVNVNGKDCSPGSTNSAASDYVAINAPELQVTDMQVPVHQNGSWHGSFRVPAGSNAGIAAAVAALCVTDTLPSLSTWYMPQTFTVTAPAPTTTTTTAPGGTTPTTPTTKPPTTTTPPTHGGGPSPDGGGAPGSTSPVFGGFPPGPASGNAGGGTGKSGSAPTGSSTAKGRTAAARAADLSVPELPSARVAGPRGLGWLSWVLLCALIAGAIGAPLWLRRSRRSVEEDDGIAAVGTL